MHQTELYHHGIKGQKWGIRRYQNPDGTLTAEGKARLEKYRTRETNRISKEMIKNTKKRESTEAKIINGNTSKQARLMHNLQKYTKRGKDFLKEYEYVKNMSYKDMVINKKIYLSEYFSKGENGSPFWYDAYEDNWRYNLTYWGYANDRLRQYRINNK